MLAQLTILAPGLLGASVARAANARSLAGRIVVWARRAETRQEISAQPWCDEVADDPEGAVMGASLVVIAAPVDQIPALTLKIAPFLSLGTIVTDVGSTKGEIARYCAGALGKRAHFVGSHPMAGSEKTGWAAGTEDMFVKRTCFVTPLPTTDARATETVVQFWRDLGAEPAVVDPDKHDEIVAHISHLPQVLASTLCAFLATKDKVWGQYAGGGLRDTTRIAGSDPELWRTILEQNRDEVLRALNAYENELHAFRSALANRDYAQVTAQLERGREYRSGVRPAPPP
jgi:prephenate dehydrogenase